MGRLHRGSAGQLTLVSAGPGSGKTLAVASWLAGGAFPGAVAWLTMDETHNDLRTFWADVLSALAIGGLAAGSVLELVPAGHFGDQEIMRVRAGLAELPVPAVQVLDDFQQVGSSAVLQSLNSVIGHQPPNLRLVLITRADPVLRLQRLRVSGD
jgi:LuxR family maltose regulon positive regulatory protein